MKRGLVGEEIEQSQSRRKALGDKGSPGGAAHAHFRERTDAQNHQWVEDNVDDGA